MNQMNRICFNNQNHDVAGLNQTPISWGGHKTSATGTLELFIFVGGTSTYL